ncbi:hypothetical protein HZF02_16760 [Pseudomonas yamanorum]|nr:hypothetical protein HZF02_01875 [Pseudomonas yamanorum]QLG93506.1 hypothetical protein HZF02_16760 [Pseudomonas yamanorum]
MAEYGLNVFDANGIKTFGMDDLTIQRLHKQTLPAMAGGGQNFKYDYIQLTIPGYDRDKCYVIFTPVNYSTYNQGSAVPAWPSVPTYVDLGGEVIGICWWSNYGVYDGHRYKYYWRAETVECTIEVVRVL